MSIRLNRFKGEVTLEDGTILVLDFNSISELESMLDVNGIEFLTNLESGKLDRADHLRYFVLASMLKHQPDATLADAGDILSEYTDIHLELLKSTLPDPEEIEKLEGKTAKKK